MNTRPPLVRSPELMSPGETALLVVDVQEKLIGLVPGHLRIVWNLERLICGAAILGLARAGTEQYPQGLGHTVAPLADALGPLPAKVRFSCGGCPEIFDDWASRDISKILVAGIETHVCVQQTVFDLMAAGYRVYVAVDAVGARHDVDHQTALRRMDAGGAVLTTTEAALFEWCQEAGTPQFKQISRLVRQPPPE